MHDTALEYGKLFLTAYLGPVPQVIVEVGSQNINGSVRDVIPSQHKYTGLDFVAGKNVDILLSDPYNLPVEDDSADVCISTSCMEHAEFFWLSFMEMIRILKPSGVLYLNSPSNGKFHRHPMDCWRFYPDSGLALQHWANRNGIDTLLLESFIGVQKSTIWNDWVAVFVKDKQFRSAHPRRMLHSDIEFTNGYLEGDSEFHNFSEYTEDHLRPKPMIYRKFLWKKAIYLQRFTDWKLRQRRGARKGS